MTITIRIFICCLLIGKYEGAYSQREFVEFIKNKEKLQFVFDTASTTVYENFIPLIKKNIIYSKSKYALLAIAYSNLGKNSQAKKCLKNWIKFGGHFNNLNIDYFNKEVQAWISENKNMPVRNGKLKAIEQEYNDIFITDQLRAPLMYMVPGKERDSLWRIQKKIDSINYIRLKKIFNPVLKNYFYINHEGYVYKQFFVLAGHYKEEQCRGLHNVIVKYCKSKKCDWEEAVGTEVQLLFKFPFYKDSTADYHYLRDVNLTKSNKLDVTDSYLQIYAMNSFLFDNPSKKVELFNCDKNINSGYLAEIGNALTSLGVSAERVKIVRSPCLFCKNVKFVAGWKILKE